MANKEVGLRIDLYQKFVYNEIIKEIIVLLTYNRRQAAISSGMFEEE